MQLAFHKRKEKRSIFMFKVNFSFLLFVGIYMKIQNKSKDAMKTADHFLVYDVINVTPTDLRVLNKHRKSPFFVCPVHLWYGSVHITHSVL